MQQHPGLLSICIYHFLFIIIVYYLPFYLVFVTPVYYDSGLLLAHLEVQFYWVLRKPAKKTQLMNWKMPKNNTQRT